MVVLVVLFAFLCVAPTWVCCMYQFVLTVVYFVCVQLGMYASPRYVTIPTPTHPPQPKGMCVCVCVQWECMQVQGMLPIPTPPTHPNPKVCVCVYSWECMQVQGMLPSPPHPPTPTQRYVCVCTVGNVCKSKVCYHPHPHPPQPKGMCVCVCACVQLGMYASPGYVTIPPHPPTPTQRYVCVCVQMSPQKHFVCTYESDLCAQMSPHPHWADILLRPFWAGMHIMDELAMFAGAVDYIHQSALSTVTLTLSLVAGVVPALLVPVYRHCKSLQLAVVDNAQSFEA